MEQGDDIELIVKRAGRHWSLLPLFVRTDGKTLARLSAQDLKVAVRAGNLSRGELLLVRTFPHRSMKSVSVGQVLEAVNQGLRGLEKLTYAEVPESEVEVEPAITRDQAKGTGGGPSTRKLVAKEPNSQPFVFGHPAESYGPSPDRGLAFEGAGRLFRTLRGWNWRKLLNWKVGLGIGLSYCLVGMSFWFFITSNPEATLAGIGLGLLWAVIKSVGVLVGLFLCVSMLLGHRDSGCLAGGVSVLIVIGLLFGASNGYWMGFEHLRANQLAPTGALIDRCMEEGVVRSGRRVGAVCSDGWRSGSTGRGTCSSHGGVAEWTYAAGKQTRTVDQCRAWARRIQW